MRGNAVVPQTRSSVTVPASILPGTRSTVAAAGVPVNPPRSAAMALASTTARGDQRHVAAAASTPIVTTPTADDAAPSAQGNSRARRGIAAVRRGNWSAQGSASQSIWILRIAAGVTSSAVRAPSASGASANVLRGRSARGRASIRRVTQVTVERVALLALLASCVRRVLASQNALPGSSIAPELAWTF